MPMGVYDRSKAKPNSGWFGRGKNNPSYGKDMSGKNNPMYGVHRFGKDAPMYDRHPSKKTKEKLKKTHLGKHHTEETKEKMRGQNSPHYGKHLSKGHRDKIGKANSGKHMNVGENNPNYGKQRTEEWKDTYSRGKNNPMYGKPTPYRKGAYYRGTWMRSSWEIKIAEWLDKQGWKWLYEPKRFELKDQTYSPDFYLPEQNVWWEIKGWFNKETQEKISHFRELYPYERLVVITEDIYKAILNASCERI